MTGARTPDAGVKSAMFKALYEVVSKAGTNMGDPSKISVLGLIEEDSEEDDGNMTDYVQWRQTLIILVDIDEMVIASARLLGALVKYLSPDEASRTLKYVYNFNHPPLDIGG